MTTWGNQGRRRLTTLAVLATAAIALPAGWAVGQEVGELSGEERLSAEDCGEATSLFEQAGLIAPTLYAGECPSNERVLEVVFELERAGRALAPAPADDSGPPATVDPEPESPPTSAGS